MYHLELPLLRPFLGRMEDDEHRAKETGYVMQCIYTCGDDSWDIAWMELLSWVWEFGSLETASAWS